MLLSKVLKALEKSINTPVTRGTNVAEIESKSVRGNVKTPEVISRGAVRPGDICGPRNRWGLRGWVW